MPARVRWTAFLRVGSQAAAEKLLVRLQETLGQELLEVEVGPYWKDDALHRCEFTTPLAASQGPEAVLDGLRQAGSLARSWEVGNLTEPDRLWGWARKQIVISGVDAVGFELVQDELE